MADTVRVQFSASIGALKDKVMKYSLALLVLLAAISSGLAGQPVTPIDFTQPLIGADGKPLLGQECLTPGPDGKGCLERKPLSLGDIAAVALEASIEEDRNVDGTIKFKRDQLARKIFNNP